MHLGAGDVVRVARVFLGADDRRAVGDEALILEELNHLRLDDELVELHAGLHLRLDEREGVVLDAVERLRGLHVRGDLGLVPRRFELADQIT